MPQGYSIWDKFLMGPDAYNKHYQAQQRSQAVQGLLGNPEQLPGGGQFAGPPDPARGLLGGQMTQPQFGARLMGIPGMEQAGTSIMTQDMANQGAMARAMAGYANADKYRVGAYDDMNQYGSAFNSFQKQYQGEIAAPRSAMEQWQGYNDMYKSYGGDVSQMTGSDDLQSLIALNKILKPSEAIMQDDVTNIQQAASYIGLGKVALDKLMGGNKVLDDTTRKNLKTSIDRVAKRKFEQYREIRGRYQTRAGQQGFQNSPMQRPEIPFNPEPAWQERKQTESKGTPGRVRVDKPFFGGDEEVRY